MHEYITIRESQEPSAAIEGAILVGGFSRRMGEDKALLVLDGTRVLDAIATAMTPLVRRVRLVGRDPSTGNALTGFEIQRDFRPGLGPLGGIHTALATSSAAVVLVVACDMPFVTTRFLGGLVETLSDDCDAIVPRPAGVPIAVCAAYRRSCIGPLEERLNRSELAARDFVESIRTRFVGDEELQRLDPTGQCLRNLNTPEDYEKASAAFRERK